MEITLKNNTVLIIKKSFEVSLYVLIFSFLVPTLFGILGILLDRIYNPFHACSFPLISTGLIILGTGAGFIGISIFYLGKIGKGLPASPVPPVNMVDSGPYRLSRHPIYFGASLSILGASLILRSFWCAFLSWPLLTLFLMIYAYRIEEPVLEERFGKQYLVYKKNVPLIWGLPFRRTLHSINTQLLDLLSCAVNKPFILKFKSHRLFLGYGLWVGCGSFVGLIFLNVFLINGNISEKVICCLAFVFILASLSLTRVVSMLTLMNLEKVTLKSAWYRVGFVSWGALAAALLSSLPYALLTHRPIYIWFDAIFTGLMITHFFGRIGCLFYGCCYGRETNSPIRIHYRHPCLKALREKLVKHGSLYPTQLFSASYSLFIFLLVTIIWSIKGWGIGIPTSLTFILYGIFRFMEEWFRFQKKMIRGIFSPAQLICMVLIVLGTIHLIWVAQMIPFGIHMPLSHISLGQFFNGINLMLFTGLGILTTFTFSYHRYEIGRWGKETPKQKKKQIMNLTYKKDTLHCQDWPLSQLAEKFGTPLYIINKQAAQASIENFMLSFKTLSIPAKLHYSVKTNPVPGFLQIIKDEGLSVEVISEHELILCKKIGFKWEDIVITGPAKTIDFLKRTKNSDIKMVTIESLSDLDRLTEVVEDAAKPLNVGVRISPGLAWGKLKPTLNSGAKHSPYGFHANSSELGIVLNRVKQNKYFHFMGFHMHLGSGIKDSRPYKRAFLILEGVIKKAHEMGIKSHFIDIGGGFGLATAPILNASQLMRSTFFGKNIEHPDSNNSSILTDIAKHLEETLRRLRGSGICIQEILVEPGRIISGPSELLMLSVLNVIEQPSRNDYLICDSGALSLSPLLFTEYHRIIPVNAKNGHTINYTILGNMPSSLDKLSSSTALPRLHCGDKIVLLDTGAYIAAMNNNFAGPRPAIALIDGKRAQLIRRRESIEEIYQRDYF